MQSKKINQVIEQDELDLETHFVENPFIKMREKAHRKKIDSKANMQAEDLEKDLKDEDIVLNKDEDKLVIKDLEQEEADRRKKKLLKR